MKNFEEFLQNSLGMDNSMRDIIETLSDEQVIESIENYVRMKLSGAFDGELISKAFENDRLQSSETLKVFFELRRLGLAELIPDCYPTRRFEHAPAKSYLSKFSQAYINMLKHAKSTPNMTLQEYLDLVE